MSEQPRRRTLAIALTVLGLIGLGLGSAAQLNLTQASLGAGSVEIKSCQGENPVAVEFITEFGTDTYQVSGVRLSDIDTECRYLPYSFTLTAGDQQPTESGTLEHDDFIVGLAEPVDAASVTGITLVIGDLVVNTD